MHIFLRLMLMPMLILGLMPMLAEAATVASLPADGRVGYVQKTDQGCVAGLWDSKDPQGHKPTAVAECPHQVSLTAHGRVLVLVGDAYVQTYDLASGALSAPMPLPAEVTAHDTLDPEALRSGYTPDGTLALNTQWGNPHPKQYSDNHLYLRKGDTWVLAEQLQCPEDSSCPFKQKFEAKPLDGVFGNAPGQIWNGALAGDPYVVKRIPESLSLDGRGEQAPDDGSYDRAQVSNSGLNNTIVFHTYGRYSKLQFGAQPGEDSDAQLTFGISLVTPDNRTLDITDDQFDAVIVGHYMLFYGFFEDGTRLYDVGDGRVVLDHLLKAAWLD